MYTGFLYRFRRKNTRLTNQERAEQFSRDPNLDITPDDHLSIIAFNSTYVEFIDRWFKFRGSFYDFIFFIVGLTFIFSIGFGIFALLDGAVLWFPIFVWILSVAGIAFISFILFRREFFTYTHWPIRLNRKNRMVYVFRHNGPGGVRRVPFDDVFFHLGHGTQMAFLKDVRGEVMDGDKVVDTFAVGNAIGSEQYIREIWEFIVRYMEQGPKATRFTQIDQSVAVRWYNMLVRCMARAGGPTLAKIIFPIVGLTTLTRWLVMKSSKSPVWPDDIEAECKVADEDPFDLPTPPYFAAFDYEPMPGRDAQTIDN